MMPDAQVLAVSMQPARPGTEGGIGKLIPQMWVYQNELEGGQPYRAFVSLLGITSVLSTSPTREGLFCAGSRGPGIARQTRSPRPTNWRRSGSRGGVGGAPLPSVLFSRLAQGVTV